MHSSVPSLFFPLTCLLQSSHSLFCKSFPASSTSLQRKSFYPLLLSNILSLLQFSPHPLIPRHLAIIIPFFFYSRSFISSSASLPLHKRSTSKGRLKGGRRGTEEKANDRDKEDIAVLLQGRAIERRIFMRESCISVNGMAGSDSLLLEMVGVQRPSVVAIT